MIKRKIKDKEEVQIQWGESYMIKLEDLAEALSSMKAKLIQTLI